MLNAIIIDDEMAAINALKALINKHVEDVKVIGGTTEGQKGIALIDESEPDIVFLDISMPEMSGFALLKQLNFKDFNLVFTTAHERYAIQAIKHHATDYLVKPIDIDELKTAVESIRKSREVIQIPKPQIEIGSRKLEFSGRIGLPVKEGVAYVTIADIAWIRSDGNYCIFHATDGKKYLASKNIGEYEELLPSREFFRVHKSHLINIRKVKKYIRADGYYVEMEDGAVVEISRRKKDEFLLAMDMIN